MWGVWCCGSWNYKECRNSNCFRPIQITKLDAVQHTALLPAKHSCWRASKKVGKHLLYSNGPHWSLLLQKLGTPITVWIYFGRWNDKASNLTKLLGPHWSLLLQKLKNTDSCMDLFQKHQTWRSYLEHTDLCICCSLELGVEHRPSFFLASWHLCFSLSCLVNQIHNKNVIFVASVMLGSILANFESLKWEKAKKCRCIYNA